MKFYDHAKNHTNPAVAEAIAKVRREVVEAGEAYRVEATPNNGDSFWWDGGRYDALRLAKSLKFNGYKVTLTRPNGTEVDIAKATY